MPRDIERLMHSLCLPAARALRSAGWQPPVDIYRTARGWLIKYELAGVRPEEIQLTVRQRSLTLSGLRRDMRIDEDQHSYSMEISYNQFQRTLELPCELEQMEILTDYRDGMLLVRLSAREECHEQG